MPMDCQNCDKYDKVFIEKQKRVDTKIAVDIVSLSWRGLVDKVIFVGGDSDFCPAFEEAKDAGVIIHLFYYETPKESKEKHKINTHTELKQLFDERTFITKELLDSCKFER